MSNQICANLWHRKRDATKRVCKYRTQGRAGCNEVLCNHCYNFYRPQHSNDRQHADHPSRKEEKKAGKVQHYNNDHLYEARRN